MPRRSSGLSFYKKEKRFNKKHVKSVLVYVFWGIAMVLIAFALCYCFGIKTSVIGDSMKPTLSSGQGIFIDRFTYVLSEPHRGDVIVFLPNGNKNTHYYVKRVIGVPGDTVLIQNGMVYINDKLLDDKYIFDKVEDGGIAKNGITLSDDEYFVMGDNCNNSEDSRSSNIGVVKSEYIIGKAWFHLKDDDISMGFIK